MGNTTMKKFNSFLSETRHKKKKSWKHSPMFLGGAFGEVRDKESVVENEIKEYKGSWAETTEPGEEYNYKKNKYDKSYNFLFHDHPDVEPKTLTDDHKEAIKNYTRTGSEDSDDGHASSGNMNAVLRNMEGDKEQLIKGDHYPEDVKKSIKTLSSAFTPENTNRKTIKVWNGIPERVAKKLVKDGSGSHHHLPGFTSTSSEREVALKFANDYNTDAGTYRNGVRHVVQYHVSPGMGLSAVHHSNFSEDEVVLHHGAHIEYHCHDVIEHVNRGRKETIHLHHVTVNPEHKPLHEYGEYTEW